ncbi:hypothetical protein SLEP1_g51222 [Rubroshorea leprosula]|uniref:Uncharacterized protein n=1 Tax=Rubroshorea leprosula TaxID=152421 RepID=A0AAV5M635_9ROSI|nr:hypothetical protein SLEP1_g51222 [Rubroshorea leprosula]
MGKHTCTMYNGCSFTTNLQDEAHWGFLFKHSSRRRKHMCTMYNGCACPSAYEEYNIALFSFAHNLICLVWNLIGCLQLYVI